MFLTTHSGLRCSIPPLPAGRITALEALDIWKRHFILEGVPEPESSSNYVIAHLLGAKTVSWKDLILHGPDCVVKSAFASCSIITCFHRSKMLNVRSYWSFSDNMRQSRYGGSAPNVCPGMTLVVHHLHTCVCFQHIVLINMFDWFRMPVQYVIEEWDFRDLTLKMRPPVFIPRPETEVCSQKICAQDSSNHQWSNRFFFLFFFKTGAGTGGTCAEWLEDQICGGLRHPADLLGSGMWLRSH